MLGLWATQQPQRGGTTSCGSRPSAGIDRAKCFISLKATGEQKTDYSLVGATIPATWPTGGRGNRNVGPGPGPPLQIFFGVFDGAGFGGWFGQGLGWATASGC